MGRILALDYGRRRTGIAATDPLHIVAEPIATVETKELFEWLEHYFSLHAVELVVVGLPTQTDGTPSESQRYILPFMGRFAKRFPEIPVATQDERYTTIEAYEAMDEAGLSRRRKEQDPGLADRVAASLILQRFLADRV